MKFITTIGDCNGIGIEVLFKALGCLDNSVFNKHSIDICGNMDTMKAYANRLNLDVQFRSSTVIIAENSFNILQCDTQSLINFGKISGDAGKLAAESIEKAVEAVIAGDYDGIITMPVSKESLYMSGWQYPGHTEMIADRSGLENPLMILCCDQLTVALATIHLPINKVAENISEEHLLHLIKTFRDSLLIDFAIESPSIAVLGLNPHAGEHGNIGKEEIEIIAPAIKQANEIYSNIRGPYPADGFFAKDSWKNFDGVLAMYHDQGLIPLKMIAKGSGVNVTAGLNLVRTSVDHGTAFDIAGKGIAYERSALQAIIMCMKIAQNRKNEA
jgi:4-hydroxythreonine-4-phosphate dehydrogenase